MNKTLLILALFGLIFVSSVHTEEADLHKELSEDDPEWKNTSNDAIGDREIGEGLGIEDDDKEFTLEDLD